MAERERKQVPFEKPDIFIESTGITHGVYNVPSDDESPFLFGVTYGSGDVALTIEDSTGETKTFFSGMRFRTYAGGGNFVLIPNELGILTKAFSEHGGKIPPEYKQGERILDNSKSWPVTTVRVGKKPTESKYLITNIPADDQDGNDTQFIDIEVKRNGNVVLTRRDTNREQTAVMTFKTEKNGGRFPIMAEVFTQIAKGMVETKKIRSQRI